MIEPGSHPSPPPGQSLRYTRRQALKAAGAVPVLLAASTLVGCSTDNAPVGGPPASSDATTPGTQPAGSMMSQADFIDLSSVLTGVDPDRLNLAAAGALLAGFAAQSASMMQLKAALDAQPDKANPTIPDNDVALARSLMTAWYTGMVGTGVATWTGALSWTVPHATAPGVCAGFGTWAVPPTDGAM